MSDRSTEGIDGRTDIFIDYKGAPQFIVGFGKIAAPLFDGSPESVYGFIELSLAVEGAA